MNLYDELVDELLKHGKVIKDIKYITSFTEYENGVVCLSEDEEDEEWEEVDGSGDRFNIPLTDFFKQAKDVDIYDTSANMLIVGADWWITTDPLETGFFEYIEIPKKAKNTINLAKELLASEDELDPLVILGIKFDEEEA